MKIASEKEVKEILAGEAKFRYQMLDRLRCDCNYYLGFGHRNAKHALWAQDEKDHIELMRLIYDSLPEKPQWLTAEQINEYEKQMLNREE